MSETPLPLDIATVLVVMPSWVGDTVMATPVLRALRRVRPGARIIAVMRPGLDEILAGTPWIDDTVVAETKTFTAPVRIARRVRAVAPALGACMLLPNSFRSGLLGRLTGARRRIGYARSGRGLLLTHALDAPDRSKPIPAIEYYAELAAWALGEPIDDRLPELAVTDEQRGAAASLLEGVTRPFAVFVPGANRPDKRWAPERFATLAGALQTDHGLATVAAGSPGENDIVQTIHKATKGVVNLIERGLGLGTLKAVIEQASLVVTNDTGPRHLAVALGTPVVALFGPTDHRWTTTGCALEQVLLAEPFLPEPMMADRWAKTCAISRISVADVLSACGRLLAASPAPAAPGRDEEAASKPPEAS